MSLSTSHFQLGLTGYPLTHSLSPLIHKAALQSCGLKGAYSLFPVSPGDHQALADLLGRVRSGQIQGLNVTIPHKETVVGHLDELTPTAGAIGAVNTICLRDGKLMGHNTDVMGFITDLNRFLANRQHLHRARVPVSKIENRKSSVVLGAGGAARAVVYALLQDGWDVTIVARRMGQASQLAASFPGHELRITNYDTFFFQPSALIPHPSREAFILLINATPLGMTPNIDSSPWPRNVPFPAHAAIYDLVYNPRETKFVRDACSQGLPATTGLGMLVEQAALSFQIWTGHTPRREALFEAVDQSGH